MLPEILLYVTAEAAPGMRRLGLVNDAVALWSRATRCRTAWAPHEAHCHKIVEAAISDLNRRRTALVLGSGLLRDVPLVTLLARFDGVILADAVHLWPARRRSVSPRASRVALDLTGLSGWLGGGAAGRAEPLARFHSDPTIDFVLSANVLSQLPMSVDRWRDRHPGRARALPVDIERQIVRWHLDDLARFQGRVCLLTDTRHREIDRSGAVVEETDLLHGERLPQPDDAWDWEVAPRGELGRLAAHVHRVHGYSDLGRACARAPL
jgi:hypothetical protein